MPRRIPSHADSARHTVFSLGEGALGGLYLPPAETADGVSAVCVCIIRIFAAKVKSRQKRIFCTLLTKNCPFCFLSPPIFGPILLLLCATRTSADLTKKAGFWRYFVFFQRKKGVLRLENGNFLPFLGENLVFLILEKNLCNPPKVRTQYRRKPPFNPSVLCVFSSFFAVFLHNLSFYRMNMHLHQKWEFAREKSGE